MYTTGARHGEAIKLAPAHVDPERKIAVLGKTKNGDPRIFYLTDELVEVLRVLPPRAVNFGHGPLRVFGYAHRNSSHRAWGKVCERASIPYRMPHEAGRHSFATEALVRCGIDPVTVAQLGGWRNPTQLLNRYAHAEDLGTVAEKVFGRSGKPLAQPGLGGKRKSKYIK